MKTKYPVTPLIRQELVKAGIKRFKNVKVDNDSYAHLRSMIENGGYGHLTDDERHAIAVGCCLTHPQHRRKHRALPIWAWVAIPVVITLLLLFAVKASAQTSQIDVITFRDASGVTIRSFAAPFSIKCSTNVTCAAAGSTLTITASGGGAGGYATIQSGGSVIATETVVNFLGAMSCVDDAVNTRSNCQLTANIAVSRQYLTGVDSGGNFTRAQPKSTDLSDFSTTAPSTVGQIPIFDGTKYVPGDPVITGPDANGAAPAGNPVVWAGWDGTNIRRLKTDSAGVLQMNFAGAGTVTTFSAGALSPLFTTSVATATTTPALSFVLSNAGAHTYLGNPTGGTAAPAYSAITAADLPASITSNTSGNAATATALDHNPADCTAGSAATGIDATGAASGCFTPGGLSNPMTTAGDIIYGAASGVPTRLAAGTVNQVLHSGTAPTWSAVDLNSADVINTLPKARTLATTVYTDQANAFSTGNQTMGNFNGKIYIDGTKYPISQAGIQAAINDACTVNAYGSFATDIYVPPMIINLTNTTTQQFLLTCAVNIHGSGIWATWFVVDASVPSTIPLFRVKPSTTQSEEFPEYDHFRAVGNTSGGTVFLFDGTGTGAICCARIHDIQTTGMSANAWFIDSAGTTLNFGWHHIYDNNLAHGIRMNTTNTTDSWLIEHNVFNPTTGSTNPCIDASTAQGAADITVAYNNGGCTGGFFTSTGTTQCQLLYNQIEETAGTGDANNALIDLIGSSYNIDNCDIIGNNMNVHNTATTNIRLGTTSNTKIRDNVLQEKPTTGVGINIGAASVGTQIGNNTFVNSATGAVPLTGGQVAYINSSTTTINQSADWPLGKTGETCIVASSAAINTTEAIIIKTPALAATRLMAGTHLRFTLEGTTTSTVANTSTFTLRVGTAGTTADGTVAAFVTSVAAASGTNNGFRAVIDWTVRVPGAAATSQGLLELVSDGNIGIVATPNAKSVAGTAFNSTTAGDIVSLAYKSAATTTTTTVTNACIQFVNN